MLLTTDETDKNANLPTSNLSNLKHPSSISIDWEADKYEFRHHYLEIKKVFTFFKFVYKKINKNFRINS